MIGEKLVGKVLWVCNVELFEMLVRWKDNARSFEN